jgi:NAD(P) transhydrogenase subunit alpha
MVIGIPKEIMRGENRVSATPDSVGTMIAAGTEVLVEKGAGVGSFFTDDAYRAAGASVIADVADLYARSHLILKVKEPQPHPAKGRHEVEMMKDGQCLVAFLHPASPPNHAMINALAAKRVIALTLDSVPRISRAQPMDALTSMSTVAGYKAVLLAANRLPKFMPMVATAVGVIQPASVLVIGAGVAGLQALATAKRLGAVTYAADVQAAACDQAKTLGAKIVEVNVPPEIGVGEGGSARRLPEPWLAKEREALRETVARSDMLILAALIPGSLAPVLVTEEMVRAMRPGSAIVDVAIDQGGNCEVTAPGQVIQKYGVSVDGTQNIPGSVPTTATWLFANNMYHFVAHLLRDGQLRLDVNDPIIGPCVVTKDGRVVHRGALEAMKLAAARGGRS